MTIDGQQTWTLVVTGVIPPGVPMQAVEGAVLSSVAFTATILPHVRTMGVSIDTVDPDALARASGLVKP